MKYKLKFERTYAEDVQSQGIKIDSKHYLIQEEGSCLPETRKMAFDLLKQRIQDTRQEIGELELITRDK